MGGDDLGGTVGREDNDTDCDDVGMSMGEKQPVGTVKGMIAAAAAAAAARGGGGGGGGGGPRGGSFETGGGGLGSPASTGPRFPAAAPLSPGGRRKSRAAGQGRDNTSSDGAPPGRESNSNSDGGRERAHKHTGFPPIPPNDIACRRSQGCKFTGCSAS